MNAGALLSALAAFFTAAVTGLLAFETVMLAKHRKPITAYVRENEGAHPRIGVLIAVLIALLLGHFTWH